MGRTRKPAPRARPSGNTPRADLVLRRLVDEFKSGGITETISKVAILKDPNDNRPCMSWSLKNRVLMVGQGTFDARNVAQWNRVNRRVIARRSAIYIIKPLYAYSCAHCAKGAAREAHLRYARPSGLFECAACGLSVEPRAVRGGSDPAVLRRIRGFGCQPEFRVEDTVGDALPEYAPARPPPLHGVAAKWGIQVKYQVDPSGSSLGSYEARSNTIHLGTESPWVFFHEISHAADSMVLARSGRALKGGQDPIQEAVAQLSACVLSEMYGMGSTRAHTRDYIRAQARGSGERELVRLALDVLDRVEGVLGLILSTAQELGGATASGQEDGHCGDGARAGKIRDH
ncbi:MAG: hypothetical protein OXU86_01450 [Thaumarchaeota archaeon]|nr:hypothetical protein [Nitrososphaerota archaeon]RNJ71878.1 MAG: hypothetical protein EB832_05020 [Thaumarchaeota archaeon S14]RNJ72889.1 MAG: hypothetical protein EB833_03995 [Thaumarchaeota archaeon S13]RNJ75999.1 MAG: hypothetical protein EB824_01040 [Thaumarchaeota archaeon S15]MDD9809716.1 hypothetical protein [Nitrososphaerota archaeon]